MSKVRLTIETGRGEFVFTQYVDDDKPVLPAVFAATSAAVATRPGEVAELRRTLEAVAELADLLGLKGAEAPAEPEPCRYCGVTELPHDLACPTLNVAAEKRTDIGDDDVTQHVAGDWQPIGA